MNTKPILTALGLGLALSLVAPDASAQSGDQAVCAEVAAWRRLIDAKTTGCRIAERFPAALSRAECLEKVATCKASSKRWIREAIREQTPEIEPLPQCTGDGQDWWGDHFSPAINRAYDRLGTLPNDPGCHLLNYYGWHAFHRTGNVTINVFASGRGSLANGGPAAPEPVPEPEPAPEARVETTPRALAFFQDQSKLPEQRLHISALGQFGGYYGTAFGIGGLVGVPIHQDLVPGLNDALVFEGGARMTFVDYGFNRTASFLTLVVGARWDLHLSTEWSVYAAARYSPVISFNYLAGRAFVAGGAVGAHYRFADALALRVEADGSNYGGSLNAGVSFFF